MIPREVPADDRGLLLGDGLFETILAEAGELRSFDAHLDRMTRGCSVIGITPPDPPAARAAAVAALVSADLAGGRAAVRLTWTAGAGRGLERPAGAEGRLIVQAFAASALDHPVRLATAPLRRNETSPLSRIKSLSYLDNILARRQAREMGADEALLLNGRGEIACAAAANLFWVREGRLFTPALACGVLDGIVRAQVIGAARAMGVDVVEAAEPASALEGAEGVFLSNSLIGVRAVAAVDGRPSPTSRLTDELSSRCR